MDLQEKDKLTSALLESVNMIAQAEDKKGSYNITIVATVKSRDINTNVYELDYQGSAITAYPLVSSLIYLTGNKVMVLVPNGDFGMKKLILANYQ